MVINENDIPNTYKPAKIMLILKLSKEKYKGKYFRPIVLLSLLAKKLENSTSSITNDIQNIPSQRPYTPSIT